MTAATPSDQDLVAYLDDELSPQDRARMEASMATDADVAARVLTLARTTIGLRKAFEPLLAEAPVARMLASLGEPPSDVQAAPVRAAPMRARAKDGRVSRRWMLAAGIALVALGGLGDHLALSPLPPVTIAADAGHWRDIVASYVRLYTPETFANLPADPALRARELATVGGAIGLHLDQATVGLADLDLKQAQILRYDQTPLAEIDYLDPRFGPMALCIIPSNRPPAAPQSEIRRGLNVSFWNDGHHGFMVIGAASATDLGATAKTFAGRFAAIPA
jgi:anti-sigma factor RsiW